MINPITYECRNCDLKELSNIRNFINKILSKYNINELTISHLILVVDEAVTNLLEYSFEGNDNPIIKIEIEKHNNTLKISISDNGKSFDLRNIVKVDMDNYFKNLKKGGLGIQIIKEIIDDIEYIPSDSNRKLNRLILIKQI